MFNNAVYARQGNAFERGDPIGYRCYECRKVVDAMWGETCNECQEKERRHKELIAAIEAAKCAKCGNAGQLRSNEA